MLKHLRPYFESSFPDVEIYLCFREEYFRPPIIEKEDVRIFSHKKMKIKKRSFAYVREITCNLQEHPIEAFLKESELKVPVLQTKSVENPKSYFISPKGHLPTKPMTSDQVAKYTTQLKNSGCSPVQFKCADWVIGVENEDTYMAATIGKKVTLVPNGIGSNFFCRLFPNASLEKL